MTLIFSSLSASAGIFACSDIVVSSETNGEPSPVSLPFPTTPVVHRTQGYNLFGTRQKTVISGRTMIMYSGWVVVALTVIRLVMEQSRGGEDFIDPAAILNASDLQDKELSRIGFVYHYIRDNGQIERYCFNCEVMPDRNDDNLAASGSGVKNFFENIQLNELNGNNEIIDKQSEFIAKIAVHSLFEFCGVESLDYLYGGWFETTFANFSGFEKIPYAIKLWHSDGDTLWSGGPLFFGYYLGNDLVVSRLNFYEEEGRTKFHSDQFQVSDLLNRKSQMLSADNIIVPYFVVHIVIGKDKSTHLVQVSPYGGPEFKLEVSRQGICCAWTNNLRHKLFTAKPNGLSFGVSDNIK